MRAIDIIKIIWAIVYFTTVVVWYVMCCLSIRNDKFQRPAFILICSLGVMAVINCVLSTIGI